MYVKMLWWNGNDVETPKNSVKTFSVFTNTIWIGLGLIHGLRSERPETKFLNQVRPMFCYRNFWYTVFLNWGVASGYF
jgi:hypothetical protein